MSLDTYCYGIICKEGQEVIMRQQLRKLGIEFHGIDDFGIILCHKDVVRGIKEANPFWLHSIILNSSCLKKT